MFLFAVGAGKTTTFKMLTGDILPSYGTAFLSGLNVRTELRQVSQYVVAVIRLWAAQTHSLCLNCCTGNWQPISCCTCLFVFVVVRKQFRSAGTCFGTLSYTDEP